MSFLIKPMNYLLTYLKFIDQLIKNRDKCRDPSKIVLKAFVPKVIPQPWMPPIVFAQMLVIKLQRYLNILMRTLITI